MGTRSITHIHEMDSLGRDTIVCTFYRHLDGYPSGHGDELADWLKGKRLVNGIGRDFVEGRDHNRAGQMAVELMHHLKKNTSIEVMPDGTGSEEYIYDVYFSNEFEIKCTEVYSENELISSADNFSGKNIEAAWRDEEC